MRAWDALRLAARALAAHRFRALLTLLSVAIGAFAIVLMSSLALSAFETLKSGIEEVGGARMLLLVPKQPERAQVKARGYEPGLTEQSLDSALAALPHVLDRSVYGNLGRREVLGDRGESTQANLVAGDARFLSAMRFSLAAGRVPDTLEHSEHARVCVLGDAVAGTLGRGQLIGRNLTVGGLRCRVIGVLAKSERFGFNIGFHWNELIVIPANTGRDWFADMPLRTVALVVTDAPSSNDVVLRMLNARLVTLHHGVDSFQLIDFAGMLRSFYRTFVILEVIAGCLAGVALVIGGIGIMNMMLVSVSERTREIGVQKALGARPGDLAAQFSSEAVLLSLVGGAGGTALGIGVASLGSFAAAQVVSTWVGLISWGAVLLALLSSLGIGVVFGWWPARRAAALQPVEAMRR